MKPRPLAIGLALAACGVLGAMVALSAATGATQELHEWYRAPDAYAAGLVAHPDALRALFGLDLAFLTLYALFFTALAQHLRGSWLVYVGLGALLATALLDIVEDHHIVAMLERALAGRPLDDGSIALQHVLSQTKFSISYVGLVAFGLAIPRTRPLGWILAAVLVVGTLAQAVASLAAPADLRASLDAGRWVGFFLGFGLAALWLRREPDAA